MRELLAALAVGWLIPAVCLAQAPAARLTSTETLSMAPGRSAYLTAPTPADTLTAAVAASEVNPRSARPNGGARWHQDVNVRTAVFLTTAVAGVATYGAIKWWSRGFTGFDARPEGWFAANTPKGGADKLGHAFGAYTGVRAGAEALELLGNSRADALKLATVTTLALYTGVEILDGFSKDHKFSKEDAIANLVGGAAGYVLQTYPGLDALIDFRLYYRQSLEARAEGKWEPFADYNGQKYLLVFKAAGVPALQAHPVLRYLELAVGYGVRGYDPPGSERSRHLYAGIALNVSQVLDDTVFRTTRESGWRKRSALFLELFQLPGTIAFVDRKL